MVTNGSGGVKSSWTSSGNAPADVDGKFERARRKPFTRATLGRV